MKQSFIIMILVFTGVTSCASAAELNLLDESGDLEELDRDAQILVQVDNDDYQRHDSDSSLAQEYPLTPLDVSDRENGIQSPRSRDIAICRKRCLCVAISATSGLIVSAVAYVVTRWNSA